MITNFKKLDTLDKITDTQFTVLLVDQDGNVFSTKRKITAGVRYTQTGKLFDELMVKEAANGAMYLMRQVIHTRDENSKSNS